MNILSSLSNPINTSMSSPGQNSGTATFVVGSTGNDSGDERLKFPT